ncbi:hypothetical protein FQN60_003750 [Etheostoma spectabile]|uniref:Uncharacterized protein n=1 Tax=Etheostoma spectabile TaxID=54343 RepID=A0A5J5CWK3_9PERO|nr:hypothetical protein FQN60_003750 [Etheostoma spectabile]
MRRWRWVKSRRLPPAKPHNKLESVWARWCKLFSLCLLGVCPS